MKTVSISIVVASLLISGTILYSVRKPTTESSKQEVTLAEDLRVKPVQITKDMVLTTVTDPANLDRIKNIRGFDVDPRKPLWILAVKSGRAIAVGYQTQSEDGSSQVVELWFNEDNFGRWKADTNPPIFLNQ